MTIKSELEKLYSTKTFSELLIIIKSGRSDKLSVKTAIKEIEFRGGIDVNYAGEYYHYNNKHNKTYSDEHGKTYDDSYDYKYNNKSVQNDKKSTRYNLIFLMIIIRIFYSFLNH